jgi:hypothetical protein
MARRPLLWRFSLGGLAYCWNGFKAWWNHFMLYVFSQKVFFSMSGSARRLSWLQMALALCAKVDRTDYLFAGWWCDFALDKG